MQVEKAPGLSPAAKAIKLADKICNVNDILERPPKDWDLERRANYLKWSAEVVARLPGRQCEAGAALRPGPVAGQKSALNRRFRTLPAFAGYRTGCA